MIPRSLSDRRPKYTEPSVRRDKLAEAILENPEMPDWMKKRIEDGEKEGISADKVLAKTIPTSFDLLAFKNPKHKGCLGTGRIGFRTKPGTDEKFPVLCECVFKNLSAMGILQKLSPRTVYKMRHGF